MHVEGFIREYDVSQVIHRHQTSHHHNMPPLPAPFLAQ